ncbi:MGMT family protein [Candidatus Parcubacteria bacterium]|nr:MGMT family protein [Candidatus Parcubacteria bacterium]
MTFKEDVYSVVKKIPRGKVMTYKEVAEAMGHPRAARAVGTILSRNDDPKVPCHRVIHSSGKIGKYNHVRGKSKEQLLREEGYIK